jgi:hypothetical protein
VASRRWIGNALAVRDVWTLTLGGTLEVGDILIVTIGGKAYRYTLATTVIATERAALVSAWNLLDSRTYPEFAEYTASAGGTGEIVLTAKTAGIPGTIAASTTEAGGGAADSQTFTATHTTSATGPNFWDNTANWAEGVLPVSNDDVYVQDSTVSIYFGLAQSAVALDSLRVAASYRGKIGLPRYNSAGYLEYRDTYLAISADIVEIGYGVGSGARGSDSIKLNTGSNQTAVTVYTTGSAATDGTPAFVWKGTHADNEFNAQGGSTGVGYYATEAATIKTLKVSFRSSVNDTTLSIGDTVTLTGTGSTFVQSGGVVTSRSSFLDVTRDAGELYLHGSAGVTNTVYNRGGTLRWESTGTLGGLENIGSVLRQNQLAPATVTAQVKMYNGSSFEDPNGVIVFTGGYTTVGCKAEQLKKLDLGTNRQYTVV